MDQDTAVRLAAFRWLSERVAVDGEVLPWASLHRGFEFDGVRVPLVSQQGIFKPAVMPEMPLSIRTSFDGPYADSFTKDGLLLYKYVGTDPNHWQNAGLRAAMRAKRPLVYFHGVVPARYLCCWPVYLVADDPAQLTFTVAVDDRSTVQSFEEHESDRSTVDGRRAYITSTVRRRLHQEAFRERVLDAYQQQCAMCQLRHRQLLDAAHIMPDAHELGEPVVSNGLALCKIHHAAFDKNIVGLSPELRISVRADVLQEIDGPMLRYGLQELEGRVIQVPRRVSLRPDPDRLAIRFDEFRRAS